MIKAPGSYDTKRYTILNANGGVTGTFKNLTPSTVFLDLSLAYDTNHVYLDLVRSSNSFASAAITPNQKAIANAVEQLGEGNPVYDAVLNLDTAGEAQQAFNALSGEIYASILSAWTEGSRYIRNAALTRLDEAFKPEGRRFWSQAVGGWGTLRGNENTARLSSQTSSVFIGTDNMLNVDTVVGILAGYTRTIANLMARASDANSTDYSLGLYTGHQWDKWRAKASAIYTWHEYDINRVVSFTNFYNQLTTESNAGTAQFFAELDYDTSIKRMALTPFAGLAYVTTNTGAWSEHSGSAFLSGDNAFDLFYTSLDAKQAQVLAKTSKGALSEQLTLAWQHAYNNPNPYTNNAFINAQGFTILGAPIAKDSLLIDAGIAFDNNADTMHLKVGYLGQVAHVAYDNAVSGRLSVTLD